LDVVTAAEPGGFDRMGERAVETESEVFGFGVGCHRVTGRSIDVDPDEITAAAKISNRYVPAQQGKRLPNSSLSSSVAGFAG
jgi:hypothetical protein